MDTLLFIYIHLVILCGDTSTCLPWTRIFAGFSGANQVFGEHGIYFLPAQISFLIDTTLVSRLATSFPPIPQISRFLSPFHLTILYVPRLGYRGIARGIPARIVAIRYDQADSGILWHEVGHALGLWHPHDGICNAMRPFEYVRRTRCHLTGDRLCDTYPIPFGYSAIHPKTCTWYYTPAVSSEQLRRDESERYICGWLRKRRSPAFLKAYLDSLYAIEQEFPGTLTWNIMAYVPNSCRRCFTPEQGEQMRQTLQYAPVFRKTTIQMPIANLPLDSLWWIPVSIRWYTSQSGSPFRSQVCEIPVFPSRDWEWASAGWTCFPLHEFHEKFFREIRIHPANTDHEP